MTKMSRNPNRFDRKDMMAAAKARAKHGTELQDQIDEQRKGRIEAENEAAELRGRLRAAREEIAKLRRELDYPVSEQEFSR